MMLAVCPRLRWLKCRLLRLITFRTISIVIICCIFVEIIRGLPVHKRKLENIDRDKNLNLKYSQAADIDNEVKDGLSRKTNTNQKLVLKGVSKEIGRKELNRWWPDQSRENANVHHLSDLKPLKSVVENAPQKQDSPQNLSIQPKTSFYENRIIHFDLKGAAPRISYLQEVLRLIKDSGATGILLEWEDTFPFNGTLAENRNSDAYTVEEVQSLLETARSLNLDVIPLVQTFGHLEWILKVEKFRQYRQSDMFPQVVCLSDEDGVALVLEAIRQVIQIHQSYGIRYFHIGADEAFQYGECEKDVRWMAQHGTTKEQLASAHLAKIATYVKNQIPGVRVLAWHDMIQSFEFSVRQYSLDHLLEIVVWDYSETLQQQNELTWRMLATKFPNVWGSSAYKGANEPSSQYLDLMHYVRNNKAWIQHRTAYGSLFRNFRGLILTGWQRYDHFAVLCEILPIGLPSAVVNLLIAKTGDNPSFFGSSLLHAVKKTLRCTSHISFEQVSSLRSCEFPGAKLFFTIQVSLRQLIKSIETEIFENYQVKGWLNRFNVRHNYTQTWYLVQLEGSIRMYFESLLEMTKEIRREMTPIFRKNTIDEWIFEYVDPITERLEDLLTQIKQLKGRRSFPVRNFDINRRVKVEL